ncbi:hypothetical protein EV360DRAFT_90599 [Lentinula raphanica]|nr:hypothetical protein EV360DRAFT_90599 [Lentinula raphanica]
MGPRSPTPRSTGPASIHPSVQSLYGPAEVQKFLPHTLLHMLQAMMMYYQFLVYPLIALYTHALMMVDQFNAFPLPSGADDVSLPRSENGRPLEIIPSHSGTTCPLPSEPGYC